MSVAPVAADHAPLAAGWTAWRWVCLRGAGFPISSVLQLADAECAAAADRALAQGRAGEAAARAVYDRGLARTSDLLRQIAAEPRFREAVLWQNRAMVRAGVDVLARRSSHARDSETRKLERKVAGYLQRYCAKNDTIGFFGPVGWALLTDAREPMVVRPGAQLLGSRQVYFEYWAMDALAQRLAKDPELKPYLRPRRMPTVRVEGNRLHVPIERSSEVPLEFARLLASCDGRLSARELATALLADPELELDGEAEVFDLLGQLVDRRLATWTLEVPPFGVNPEELLRRELSSLEETPARARALAALDELDRARAAVAACAGDPARLDPALGQMEATFARLTGAPATRRAGEIYAARSCLYEDCRRDVEVIIGRDAIERLGRPLKLVLDSARWFTYTIGNRYRVELEAIYRRLCAERGASTIDYTRFFEQAAPQFAAHQDDAPPLVRQTADELHARWSELLALDLEASRVSRGAEALEERARALFAAPHPGWPAARQQSPDLLIAANDLDAIARQDFTWVLGELHAGLNTIWLHSFLAQHPDPAELIGLQARDLPMQLVSSVLPRERYNRSQSNISLAHNRLDVETSSERSWRPREQVLQLGELIVGERDGRVFVGSRDGRSCLDPLVFFEQHILLASATHFTPLPRVRHRPRVTIDGLVLAREQWTFTATELAASREKDPFRRYLALRRWAGACGLPRFLFVKVAEERKPVYVDLDSPIYVECLAKLLGRTRAATVTEMLPRPDQAWLTDAENNRYACELRMVAVDEQPWRTEGAGPRP
jgi:hypothetical protein